MKPTIHVVRAFTANGAGGNPAGVVLAADNLSDAQMQLLAQRVGHSETAFVCRSDRATLRLRFFTITGELDLCGHATIATWSLLFARGLFGAGSYTQETAAGLLAVTITSNGIVFMEQNPATFYDVLLPGNIAPLLGLSPDDFSQKLAPRIVSTGIRDLFVPVKNPEILAQIQADLPAIITFSRRHDISSLHVFALLHEANNESVAAARNFAPIDGIDEEAATGTSSGALLCYLKKYGQLRPQKIYRLEQGAAMNSLSYIYGKFASETVWIGGSATEQASQTTTDD